jgi:hypothetical protein
MSIIIIIVLLSAALCATHCVAVRCLMYYPLCYSPLPNVLPTVLLSAAQCATYCVAVRCLVCYLL